MLVHFRFYYNIAYAMFESGAEMPINTSCFHISASIITQKKRFRKLYFPQSEKFSPLKKISFLFLRFFLSPFRLTQV